MGINRYSQEPCGFCFVEYFERAHALEAIKYISATHLDNRIIRCDIDYGFEEGRQFGRGNSGGQVFLFLFLLYLERSEMSIVQTLTKTVVDLESLLVLLTLLELNFIVYIVFILRYAFFSKLNYYFLLFKLNQGSWSFLIKQF